MRSPTMDFKKIAKNKKNPYFSDLINLFQRFFNKKSNSQSKRSNNWSKKSNSKNTKSEEQSGYRNTYKFLMSFKFLLLPLFPVYFILKFLFERIAPYFSKASIIKILFSVLFLGIIFNFAKLQVLSSNNPGTFKASDLSLSATQLILARRGQIYLQDLSQNQSSDRHYVSLTSSENVAHLYFNPYQLKGLLQQGVKLDEVVAWISGSLNLPYDEIYNLLKTETDKPEPKKYVLIKQFISENQKSIVEYLKTNSDTKRLMQQIGLDIVEKEIRSYPQGPLLAQTVGYVPKYQVSKNDALNIGGCKDMVQQNEQRGTAPIEYPIGYFGLEQKFCSVLAGLNGRQTFNNEINTDSNNQSKVQDGANIYITADKNLQLKTEQILDKALKDNTNANGSPKNATAIVMEAKTGKILSMATSPTFDPGRYNDYSSNVEVYRNQATGGDYEVGSVAKPLTLAAVLNDYQLGKIGSLGQRIGVAPDWKFKDFDSKGMPFEALNGDTLYIRNSKGQSYANLGYIGLDTCILYSINTCISTAVGTIGNGELRYYFEDLYGFGRGTAINLPGDSNGSRNSSIFAQDINCPSCYARYGFGQGFFISPIQLLRGYTAIANRGTLTEPYLVEKIKYPDGTEDYGSDYTSPIRRELPKQIIKESVARQVTDYMVGLIQNTLPGVGANKANVPGYTIACKTGTAEKITNVNGKVYSYEENRNKGLYIHTMVCFNVSVDNPLLFLIKIDEPKPGQVDNFSGDTIGPAISDLMKSTFQYLNIAPDKA